MRPALLLPLLSVLMASAVSAMPDRRITPPGAAVEFWRVEIDGTTGPLDSAPNRDEALDVALDLQGNPVAVGFVKDTVFVNQQPVAHRDFYVTKRDAATGAEIATYQADMALLADRACVVEIDSNGNTIAAGRFALDEGPEDPPAGNSRNVDLAVVKLDAQLNPVWPQIYLRDGSAEESKVETANALALDTNDDIFVAGILYETGTGRDAALCKIDGSTGLEVWCAMIDGAGNPPDESADTALDVAVDANGDVIVIGRLIGSAGNLDLFAAKYAGAGDGFGGPQQLWLQVLDGPSSGIDGATAVALDAGGDAYVTGFFYDQTTDVDIAVLRLASADGGVVWSETFDDPASVPANPLDEFDAGFAIRIEPTTGDVIVAGTISSAVTNPDMFFARLDESDGSTIWRGTADGTMTPQPPSIDLDEARDIALLANGDIAIAGSFENDYDMMSENTPPGESDPSFADFSVIVLDGNGDGNGGSLEKWRIDLLGFDNRTGFQVPPFHEDDFANKIVAGADDHLFAVGRLTRPDNGVQGENSHFTITSVPEADSGAAAAALALVAWWGIVQGAKRRVR